MKFLVFAIWLYCVAGGFSALAQTESSGAYAEAASAFQQGKLDDAERLLRAVIAGEPDRPDLAGLLAIVLDAKKDYDGAEQFHERALKLAPDSAGLWNNLGNHHLARGNEEQAQAAFLHVIAIDPRHANANLQLARIAVSQKQGAQALRYLEKLGPTDQNVPAIDLLRARALHLAGQADAAMAIVDRLERDSPSDTRLVFSLGIVLAEWEKYDRAENAFSRALESDPSDPEILGKLGLAALRAGHFDRAKQVFEVALAQRPGDVETIFNLARVHAAQGDDETALVLLAQARRLAPDRADLLLALAKMYAQAGFFSGAADAYEAYLKLQPGDRSARRERGFAYCRFGRVQQALPDLKWYVEKYPADPVGHFELGLCHTLGDAGQALHEINEALRLKPDYTSARHARGWLYERDGKWQEAFGDLKLVVEQEPKNSTALERLGRAYLELEQPAKAVDLLRRAGELDPENTGILMQLHKALRAVGRNRDAAAVLEKLKSAPPDSRPLKAQAQVFDYLNLSAGEQRERFQRNLMQAIAAQPADPELKVQLGRFLLNEGKIEDGLAAMREVLALSPGSRVLNDGAAVLADHKQYALAREFLDRIVAQDPSVENRLNLAVATFHSANPEASLGEIEKIPATDQNGDFYLLKAQILDALGRFQDAAKALNTGFQLAPTRADLYLWASLFLLKYHRDQQALELLEQATKIVPDDPDLSLSKAVVLELLRKTEQADDVLKKIQLRWPEWGRSYLIRGIIQETHRNPEEALQSIRTAIALGERTPKAYYYLAEATRSAKPDDSEGAGEAIAEALRLDPNDPWFHSLAAKIALDAGKTGDAVDQLKKAIRVMPNLAEAHYSLSIAYKRLGREDEAASELAILRRIRELNPQPEEEPAGIRQLVLPVVSPQ